MQKYGDLKKIEENTITEKQALDLWSDDINHYNNVKFDHNQLISWIKRYCQK